MTTPTFFARVETSRQRLRNHPGHDQKSHGRKGGGVRESLAGAKTSDELNAAATAEAKRITGRDIPFDMAGVDVEIAREWAEGTLQGLERFPKAPLGAVRAKDFGSEASDVHTYAHALLPREAGAMYEIEFNSRTGSVDEMRRVMEMKNARGVFAFSNPTGAALHEFGHVVSESSGTSHAASTQARAYARSQPAGRGGSDKEDLVIMRDVSFYARRDSRELAAEGFADVMANGAGASETSKVIFSAIEAGYVRGGS